MYTKSRLPFKSIRLSLGEVIQNLTNQFILADNLLREHQREKALPCNSIFLGERRMGKAFVMQIETYRNW
jgi:hypothetical protein